MSSQTVAIYPGSFDPITCGHLNIIERSLNIFDQLVIGVAVNVAKTALFSAEERIEQIQESTGNDPRISVDFFDELLVDFARKKGANVIVRGLRAISDFEYEFQMAHMNHKLDDTLETVFMMTGETHFYVSSRLVKEVAFLGGDIGELVPENVS